MQQLETPIERPGAGHAWHLYALRLHRPRLRIDRNRFLDELGRRNIGTSVHFVPVHLHRYYRDKYGFQPGSFPVALREFHRLVSLPIHPGMTEGDVEDVIAAVLDVVAAFSR